MDDLQLFMKMKNEIIWLQTPITEYGIVNDKGKEDKFMTTEGRKKIVPKIVQKVDKPKGE